MRGNCQVSFIVGKRGSGKTELAKAIVKRSELERSLCYDSNGHDYRDGVICEGMECLKAYWRRVKDGSYRLIYRSAQPRKDFDTVCLLVMAAGNMAFIVDEVDMYIKDGEPGESFSDVIRRGRHNDVELICITQRPRQMGEIRSMANTLYIFETHEPSDLQYFKQSFGSEKLIAMIQGLKKYEYVKVQIPFEEDTLEVCKERYFGPVNTHTAGGEVHQQQEPGEPLGLRQTNGDSAGSAGENPMA